MPFDVKAALSKAGVELEVSDEAATAINAAADADEAALKAKRDELLETQKKLKAAAKVLEADLKTKTEEADAATSEIETTAAELERARKAADDPEAQETLRAMFEKQRDTAVAKVQGELDAERQKSSTLESEKRDGKVKSAFDEAFKKHRIMEDYRRGKRLEMIADAKSIEVDDDGHTMIDGISVDDHVASFASDETKKNFLAAPDSTGGGATGSGNDGGQQVNPWAKESFNLSERGRIQKENPALAAQLKSQAGVK